MRLSRRQVVDDVATARRNGNENWAFLLGLVGRSARKAAEVITAGDIIAKTRIPSDITFKGIDQLSRRVLSAEQVMSRCALCIPVARTFGALVGIMASL